MKKCFIVLLALILVASMFACTPEQVMVTCDSCGNVVPGRPNMDDSWIIYCEDCSYKVPSIEYGGPTE